MNKKFLQIIKIYFTALNQSYPEDNMKPEKYISKILEVLTVLCLLLFFASFGFRDSRTGGWYQQFFPNMNGCTITSMTFVDSLIGYAVTNQNSSVQSYIIKTTNGGDNWNIILSTYPNFNKIIFLDVNTGFASAYTDALFHTTNGGLNWTLTSNGGIYPNDMAVLNKDTILYVRSDGFDGGVYRTTNGGLNWSPLGQVGGTGQPNRIYMLNKDIGFSDDNSVGTLFKKTTNGGFNWTSIPNESFTDIKLIDSLVGWKCAGDIKKTSDGGLTWNSQQLPQIFVNTMYSLSIPNVNKMWGVGGSIIINNIAYGVMYKSTNGGNNWGYQRADTSIHIGHYDFVNFINNYIGWAHRNNTGVHTTIGGSDTTFYTNINNNITSSPKEFILYQNYPNPFNPLTSIKYQVSSLKNSVVKLVVYNITGKEINTLVNAKKYSGTYEVTFNGDNLPSGIYFYTLSNNGLIVDTKKAILLK